MKKLLIAAGAIVVVALALFVLLKPTAKVAAVIKGRATNAVSGSVTVQAEYQMELKSEIGGRLIRSELDPGKKVEAGAVLAQIDPGDLQLEIERIEQDYDAAKKRIAVGSSIKLELETATEALANFERLTAAGSYPATELEKQRRLVKQVEQRLALEDVARKQEIANFENTLRVKHRQLDKMTITAPFDGIVSLVFARPGDLINPNAPIATLISTSRAVEAKISQENFAEIRLGQKATVRFLGRENDTYDATVSKILPTADAETQRYPILLEVQCPPEVLVPGLTGEVNVIVGSRDADALVPRRALFGTNVYAVVDGRVELRKVEVGYVSLNIAEITKGLKAGDLVIVEELDKFRAGDRVRTELVGK
ncbi:MAG TPA: efflux RND transporter periplasmic adaptor subunit [Opitutaceae bacterium]|nr:efflux RND transporter periplasmic adaptor subunit [Opitutaceae bacterium]